MTRELMTPEQQLIEQRLNQMHDYIRHIYQLLVTWFTFFVTVNYATMGWLFKPSDSQSTSRLGLSVLALVFTIQNVLGIIACIFVHDHLSGRATAVRDLEKLLSGEKSPAFEHATVPSDIYSHTIFLMILALIMLIIAWCSLPCISQHS